MPHDEAGGLNRRQMLRRGVAVGSVVWTVPTVTAIALTPANAASPSGEPPTKPPTKPPEPPEPTNKPTPPPTSHTPEPPPSNETTPPGEKPTPKPTPTGSAPPPGGDDDTDTTAGGSLADTGPGGVGEKLAVGGLLTAAGAAMYVASRREPTEPGDQQEATA